MVSISRIFALIIYIMLVATGCTNDQETGHTNTLRIAVLPDQQPERLKARYAPLVDYLSTTLNSHVELVIPENYSDLLDKFHRNEIDLANFGGLSYLKAHHQDGAIPVVMRDIDAKFTSVFLVRGDSPATQITDFRGKKLSFGSELSTSGHLMPRYFLQSQGIIPEDYFASVAFSGTHDTTAYHVRDGIADIGAANTLVIEQLYRDQLLNTDQVRILWQTPAYADYVWAIQKSTPAKSIKAIQSAFLNLTTADAKQKTILDQLGAGSYLPAKPSDFILLEHISKNLGLLDAT